MKSAEKKSGGFAAVKRWLNDHFIIYAVVVLAVVMSFVSDKFMTLDNVMNIFRQTSMVAIVAIGAFYTIVGGGIDLSNSSIAGFAGIVFAMACVNWGLNPIIAVVLALLAGALMGGINGAVIAYGGVPPFIATLGMQIAGRGLCFVTTNAYPITGLPASINFIGRGYIGKLIPVPVVITIIVFLIMGFVAQKTRYGRSVFAVGSNADGAHFSGINTKKIKAGTYLISGLMAGVAAIILTSRVASGQPNGGLGWETDAITAAAIGGVSMAGGKGSLIGVFFGALFVGMLTNVMTLMDMNSYYQQIVEGIVLVFAIFIDCYRTKKANKA